MKHGYISIIEMWVYISDDKKYLLSKNSSQVWRLYKRKTLLDGNLLWIIGKNKFYSDTMYDELLDKLELTTKNKDQKKDYLIY